MPEVAPEDEPEDLLSMRPEELPWELDLLYTLSRLYSGQNFV